jgi:AraC-like DNA-binding protein
VKAFNVRPNALLSPYIERLWGWESDHDEILNLPILLPGTGAEVFFHYRQPFRGEIEGVLHQFDPAHMICVRGRPIKLQQSGSIGFIAIRFRAGRLHRFTAIPGVDLIDSTMSVTDLWGASGHSLVKDVMNVRSRTSAISIIEKFLTSQLNSGSSDLLVEQAVGEIYKRCSNISVSDVAQKMGVSERELQRRVKALTGHTPVEFRKISRVQHVMRELLLNNPSHMLETALKYGFYDQAHFINTFSSWRLGSPQRFLADVRNKSHFYNTSWNGSDKKSA